MKTWKLRSKLSPLPSWPGMMHISLSASTVKKLGGFRTRLLCSLNRNSFFSCGLMPLGQGKGMIMISKKKRKDFGLADGKTLSVELKLDKSKYGMPVCPELAEVLKQDSVAKKLFDGLKPGKQRNIIHYVGSAKDIDLRIDRAVRMLSDLKSQ